MELKKIKEIMDMVEVSSFEEFSYEDDNFSIFLKKNAAGKVENQVPAAVVESCNSIISDDGAEEFLSPMVGTFYSAPSPDADDFVKPGDKVKAGKTLCIIEAMKMMNEIECPYDAEIISVEIGNEQRAEYGQLLFRIKKI